MKNQKLNNNVQKLSKKVNGSLNGAKYLRTSLSDMDDGVIPFLVLFFIPFGFLYLCFYRPIKKLVYRHQIKNFETKNQVLINDCCNYFKTKLPFFQDAIESEKKKFFYVGERVCDDKLKMNFIRHDYWVRVGANGFAGYSFEDYKLERISEETLRALKYVVCYCLKKEIEKQLKQNKKTYKDYELSFVYKGNRNYTEYHIYLEYKGEEYQLESW